MILAERSFDLRTSGLWAQHASTAPLCYADAFFNGGRVHFVLIFFAFNLALSLEMPGIEPGAFHMQSERATTALHPLFPVYTLVAKDP